jgi:hypothetical protein
MNYNFTILKFLPSEKKNQHKKKSLSLLQMPKLFKELNQDQKREKRIIIIKKNSKINKKHEVIFL